MRPQTLCQPVRPIEQALSYVMVTGHWSLGKWPLGHFYNGCYQIRSLSPTTSHENYALKLSQGYSIHPHPKHDAYYFIKTLQSGNRTE